MLSSFLCALSKEYSAIPKILQYIVEYLAKQMKTNCHAGVISYLPSKPIFHIHCNHSHLLMIFYFLFYFYFFK